MDSVGPISYTNRKGKTYYLHAVTRKSGKTSYVMKLSEESALTELPEGYSISESVNGQVSVGRAEPRATTEREEAEVAAILLDLGLKGYRCVAKGPYITVYEPLLSEEDLRETYSFLAGPFMAGLDSLISEKLDRGPHGPVMRFRLVDEEQRLFTVERMTYRGDGRWHSLTGNGAPLPEVTRKYLAHLGRESFFDLI
ncbi:MAG: hypothetical protein IT364_01595 [Candidatus Hydrogenedentes bacterium]|nr:hypothetical protein [Candidatus Hydrogenedentota bacterium]